MPAPSVIHKLLSNTKLRLHEEYGWDFEFVIAAINEYIRFLELHVAYPNVTIVPGKVVDKVWHNQILHTRAYIDFCNKAFGHYLHHDPKDRSLKDAVMDIKPTADLYAELYGHEVPKAYWLEDVKVKLPHHSEVAPSSKDTKPTYSYSGGCCRCH